MLHQTDLNVHNGLLLSFLEDADLAASVAQRCGCDHAVIETQLSACGDRVVRFPQGMQDRSVVWLQRISRPFAQALFDGLQAINALKQCHVRSITIVLPCYPYARQVHQAGMESVVLPRLVSELLLAAGGTGLITVDIHGSAQCSEFALPTHNLSTDALFLTYLQQQQQQNGLQGMIIGADGSAKLRAQSLAEALCWPYGWIDKQRDAGGIICSVSLHGPSPTKTVFVVDDRIDSGGTLCAVAKLLKQCGVQQVIGVVTHGVVERAILEALEASGLDHLVETDTRSAVRQQGFTTVLSVAELLANAIKTSGHDRT